VRAHDCQRHTRERADSDNDLQKIQ
jgi:hypothetical protein